MTDAQIKMIKLFLHWSIKAFLVLAVLPAVATFVLSQGAATKMLAAITALYLYAIPSLVIGAPFFTGEFYAPQNVYAYGLVIGFWVLVSLTVGAIRCWLSQTIKSQLKN